METPCCKKCLYYWKGQENPCQFGCADFDHFKPVENLTKIDLIMRKVGPYFFGGLAGIIFGYWWAMEAYNVHPY